MYPLVRELFALLISDIAVEIDLQNFAVDIQSKQI